MNQSERMEELVMKIRRAEAKGDLLEQAELLEQAVVLSKELYGAGSSRHIELQSEYGGILKYIGRPREAVAQLQEVKELLESEKESGNYVTALVNLAGAYRFCQEYEKSEALYLEARERNKARDYVYASICNNLGILYQDQKQWEKAEALCLESLEILRDNPEYGEEYAATLSNLASVYLTQERCQDAKEMLSAAQEYAARTGGTKTPLFASILNQKAALFYRTNELEAAYQAATEAYEICREKLGENSEACRKLEASLNVIRESMGQKG